MTQEPHDEDYFDLFKPKAGGSEEGVPSVDEAEPITPAGGETSPSQAPVGESSRSETEPTRRPPPTPDTAEQGPQPQRKAREIDDHGAPPRAERSEGLQSRAERSKGLPPRAERSEGLPPRPERSEGPVDYRTPDWTNAGFEPVVTSPSNDGRDLRTVGVVAGAGCLLLVLTAIVVFAFYQIFVREGGEEEPQATLTPTTVVAVIPTATPPVAESPLFAPLVGSSDVRVPVALPELLTIGESVFSVQAVKAPTATWPDAPTSDDIANWAYGTVVNYILGLAPTVENIDLISTLQGDDTLSLHMSTGLVLNFNVRDKATGTTDDLAFFDQNSPRLTLALLADDPAQRVVVTAGFSGDEAEESDLLSGAAIGLVGTPVQQGPARVTVIETYQMAGREAGLLPGTGYLLLDIRVENTGSAILEPGFFQTFVSDALGERYPLTMLAEQFAHYGIPTEPLAPGETVIGSVGYLVSRSSQGQVRWAFNPLPGSEHWVVVPISFELPSVGPTAEPPPSVGFALVTVDTRDVFVNPEDDLLDIGLRIENVSEGVVTVGAGDISLSSWTEGELTLVAPAPPLPWTLGPGELQLFQLQFELPTADSALLSVLGYTFSIENLGGQ